MQNAVYILLGLVAGIFGGMFGLGGGVVIIPALVYLCAFTQHQAQGTNLAAMLPPIGILAVWQYWKAGNVKLPVAGLLSIGFVVGALLGAQLVQQVPGTVLKKLFGVVLLLMSVRMIVGK